MAESNLGEAVLTIRVESALALQEIGRVKAALASGFETATPTVFSDLPKQARQAGEQSGRQLRSGLQSTLNAGGPLKLPQLQVPDFSSIREALNFSGELRATISDLQTYRKALIALRDATGATDPLFKRLTATIQASGAAIKDFERGTGDLVESLARVKNVAAGLTFDAQLAALRAFRSGLQSVANTALDAAKAVASITAKGAIETLKVPVFGLPKETTGIIEKARAQIERLQKQSETASGKVARLSDGVAALGIGGLAAKGVVDVVGDIGQSAANTANLLGQVSKSLNDLPGPLSGLGGISDIFANGNEALQQWAANLLRTQSELSGLTAPLQTVTDLLTSLGPEAAAVGGALAFTFAGFQDLINRSFQPGIEGARNALRGMTEDTQNLLEALARASEASAGLASLRDLNLARASAVERAAASPVGSEENLQATQELVELNQRINDEKQRQFYLQQQILLSEKERAAIAERLRDAATPSSVLALPSSELLQQRVAADGGVTPRRLAPTAGPAIDVGLQNARNFVEELGGTGTTFKRLGLNAGEVDGQLTGLPAIFSLVGDALQGFAGAIGRAESDYQARMQAVNASLEDLRRATQSAADRRDTQARAIGEFGASPITGRRPDGTAIGGSPAFKRDGQAALRALQQADAQFLGGLQRAQADRRRRIDDATGSAVIGGAFPLLFGQGLGASVGGGLGGFAGGLQGGQFGFGLSLVGTAVGAQLDAAVAKLGALGSALSNPVEKFSELQQAGVLSSKALEGQVQSLIAVGREAEAAALIQQDLAKTYGDLSSAKELAAESDKLNRTWSQLQVTVAGLAATGVTGFLEEASAGLRGFAETIQFFKDRLPKGLPELPKDLPLSGLRYGGIGLAFEPLKAAGKLFGSGGIFNPGGKPASTAGFNEAKQEKALRSQIQQLTLDQIKAEASGNTGLNTRLQLKLNELKLEQELARLRLKPNSGPEQQQARENAQVERTRIQEQAKAAARVLASQVKSRAEISNSEKLVTAQLNGYERQSLELEKQLALNERNRQLLALPPELRQNSDQARVIEQQAALRIFEINQRIAKSDEKRWADSIAAANRLRSIQEQTAIEAARPNLTSIGTGVLQSLAALRDARRAEENAQAQLRVTPGDPQLLNASKEASANVRLAAAKTKADLLDAFKAAQDAVRNISRSFEDAKLSLAELQNTSGQGVNRYLNAQQVRQRQEQLNPILVAKAQRAVGTFEARTGIKVPNLSVTGTLEQRNAQLIDVARVFDNESRAVEDLNLTNLELIKASNSLALATAALDVTNTKVADALVLNAQTTSKLIDKNWEVNVNVQAPPAFIPSLG